MLRSRLWLIALVVLTVAQPAFAARKRKAPAPKAKPAPAARVQTSSEYNEVVTERNGKRTRTLYPKHTSVDFEGAFIQGEVKNPGEIYFQRRPLEKFDSLVKRRAHFHPEMLRDAVLSK